MIGDSKGDTRSFDYNSHVESPSMENKMEKNLEAGVIKGAQGIVPEAVQQGGQSEVPIRVSKI